MSQIAMAATTRARQAKGPGRYRGAVNAGSTHFDESKASAGSAGTADRGAFVTAMRGAVTGVNVVTTDGLAGRFGITVSAFSSVSADPPMVLVCINRRSPARAAVLENRHFCVNVLSTEQRHIADTFAGRPAEGPPYDFTTARWTAGFTGAPSLADAVARFDCVVEIAVDSGSHTVFIGRVSHVAEGRGQALLYRDRGYGRPCADL